MKKAIQYETPVFLYFVHLTKAYDSIRLWRHTDRVWGVPPAAWWSSLKSSTHAKIITSTGDMLKRFKVKTGIWQGCVQPPLLFNSFMDKILREATTTLSVGFRIENATIRGLFLTYWDKTTASTFIQDAMYAGDLTLVTECRQ